jgi:hypothetical protein
MLCENASVEVLRAMEIRLFGMDGIPRHIMGLV